MNSLGQSGPKRAAIYVRVSTLEQGARGYSLDSQAGDCRKLADELDAAVVAEFGDTDSGASLDLPGLNAMLDAARRREFDLLLVYDPDRLARRMAKQLVIEDELQRSGVVIRYVTLRVGESAEDQLLKNVRSSIAEYERAKIALRTSRGRRAKAERGMIVGNGWAPYGYQFAREFDPKTGRSRVVGLEPDPETAPIVRRIFGHLQHMSIRELCDRLNTEGIATYFDSGRGWSNTTILGIVDNPVYLGTAAYGRRDTNKHWRAPSEWLTIAVPPLVERKTWETVKDALARRRSKRGPHFTSENDPYLVRNLVMCHHCGGALACVPNNGRRYYTCLRTHPNRIERTGQQLCTLPAAPAQPLEAHIWDRVSAALLDPENLAEGLAAAREENVTATSRRLGRLDTIDREVERLRSRLQRITAERLDAAPRSEAERALKTLGGEAEVAISRLLTERAELEAEPAPGLGADEAAALEAFAAEVRHGIDAATPADRRRVFELLKLTVRLRRDESEAGIKLARKNRFGIQLRAVIELPNNGREYKKTRMKFYTDAYEEWEAKYLPVAAR